MSTHTSQHTRDYSDQPIINGKYPDGTFAPGHDIESPRHPKYRETSWKKGQSGNPGGRPEGSLNLSTPWFTGKIEPSDIEKLESMSKSQLISLLKTLGGVVGYALKDEVEKVRAAELKLYSLGMQSTEVHKIIPALREWYDRTKGKPAQAIQLDATVRSVNVNATISFAKMPVQVEYHKPTDALNAAFIPTTG